MAALKRIKQQEIPFKLDGKTIMKCVTKNTTCSDVINKLPNLETPLAVFESVDGIEKELTGKTKLLKVWRANGPTRKVEFIIRKSQIYSMDKRSSKKKVSSRQQSRVNSAEIKGLSKNTLKQVSDLAFYVRYQKKKFQALEQNSDNKITASEQNILMRRMTSNASVNSMDAFLAKADLNEMAKLLTFCGDVAVDKLNERKHRRLFRETNINDKKVTCETLKSTKLGFKQKFTTKKTVERTTSTGTISSTDTGYHSIHSEHESVSDVTKISSHSISKLKYHAQIQTNVTDIPRHSTPISAVRSQKRRADDLASTFNVDSTLVSKRIEQLNEIQGKSMILQKFMADQPLCESAELTRNHEFNTPDVKRRRIGRYSMPSFSSQEDVCRFLWVNNCDSDSECESDISEPCEILDVAFNAGGIDNMFDSQSRTLRRESAVSNLNQISLVSRDFDEKSIQSDAYMTKTLRRESAISNLNQFSLLPREIGLDSVNDSNGFDYSFDCSFPRMDETVSEDFSMDFSYDYDESDSENESYCNEDDCMDSFMKTRSFSDVSGTATVCE